MCPNHLHVEWQELLQQGQWWQQLGSHDAALKQYEAVLAAAQECSVHDSISACRGAAQCCAAMGQLRQVQIRLSAKCNRHMGHCCSHCQ